MTGWCEPSADSGGGKTGWMEEGDTVIARKWGKGEKYDCEEGKDGESRGRRGYEEEKEESDGSGRRAW